MRKACAETAFFFIKGHGIPSAMMDGIIDEARRFHGQPMDQKMKVKVGKDLHGYLPPGGQTHRSSRYNNNVKPELSASFYMRRDFAPDHPDRIAGKPWVFINKWPEEDSLPGYKQTLLDYFNALDGLFLHVMPLFALALAARERLHADPAYLDELAAWSDVHQTRDDGVSAALIGPLDESGSLPLREFPADHGDGGRRRTAQFEAHPLVAMLYTQRDSPAQWLRAGQALQRVLLTATVRGVSVQPITQPLEVPDLREMVTDARGRRHAQVGLRLGYAAPAVASRRRDLSEVLVRATASARVRPAS